MTELAGIVDVLRFSLSSSYLMPVFAISEAAGEMIFSLRASAVETSGLRVFEVGVSSLIGPGCWEPSSEGVSSYYNSAGLSSFVSSIASFFSSSGDSAASYLSSETYSLFLDVSSSGCA